MAKRQTTVRKNTQNIMSVIMRGTTKNAFRDIDKDAADGRCDTKPKLATTSQKRVRSCWTRTCAAPFILIGSAHAYSQNAQ